MRSAVARDQGLTEEKLQELWDYEQSALLTEREKAALRFAERFYHDARSIDDAVYAELQQHFTDAEIIELGMLAGEVMGGGAFARSLAVASWEEACQLNPLMVGHTHAGALPGRESAD